MTMILIIDNYDSFVYNLFQYFGDLGAEPVVKRNDEITLDEIGELAPEKIVLSPGPGYPANKRDFGVCSDILEGFAPGISGPERGGKTLNAERGTAYFSEKPPILGVCLGHQGIIHHFGGKIVKNRPMHGKTSEIGHNGKGIFKGVANPLKVMRYHSLAGTDIPDCLEITATSMDDDVVMAVQHKIFPVYGVQFHPESIMTQDGKKIVENFLGL